MTSIPNTELAEALRWCTSIVGPAELVADHSKPHGGHESSTHRLRTTAGYCYLKIHQTPAHWNQEVYAYEHWASVFNRFAPKLLAVRDKPPLALLLAELPGQSMANVRLPPAQERAIWRTAGQALAALHNLGPGQRFGPCLRNGTFIEPSVPSAVEYVSRRLRNQIERATQVRCIDAEELATLQAACGLASVFEGEQPVPCHRDYIPVNWLITEQADWAGVIDFEFAHWDVRVDDFSRDPDWSWIRRPDLYDAFLEGYGWQPSPAAEQQLLVARAQYALDAIIWGRDNAFYGFEQEGRDALVHLALRLR